MDMNNIPKVSVIIPCYNRENFIRETIESVLRQTYPNIEIITIDDGCTDSTRKILEEFRGTIKILEHPGRANRGQSASLNMGISSSNGKYIALLDSDDLFAPLKIARQVEFLEENSDIGLVYANGFAIDENGKKLYQMYDETHKEESNPERVLMDCYFLVPNNAMVRRTIFEKAGEFDEALRAGQDHDMAIRLAEVTKMAYIDEPLFYYRRHQNSISAMRADLRWNNGFVILKKAARRYTYRKSTLRKRKAVLNFRLGQCELEKGNYAVAAMRFASAAVLDPGRSFSVLLRRETITSPH
jgi:glycosyltransferase involved in cell wall biosynthesis